MGLGKEGVTCTYELLNTIEFNSTRKRMTSVFRDTNSGQIIVMCKGADSVLLPLLKDQDSSEVSKLTTTTTSFMDNFAKEGLRTLLIVEKVMSESEYDEWNTEYQRALASIVDRDA